LQQGVEEQLTIVGGQIADAMYKAQVAIVFELKNIVAAINQQVIDIATAQVNMPRGSSTVSEAPRGTVPTAPAPPPPPRISSGRGYALGGWVQQTEFALVHQGEYVLSKEMLRKLFDTDTFKPLPMGPMLPFKSDTGSADEFLMEVRSLKEELVKKEDQTAEELKELKLQLKDEQGKPVEMHIHCEGATFYGPGDFVRQIADAVTDHFNRGGFPFLPRK
jgi:hypothetical protein